MSKKMMMVVIVLIGVVVSGCQVDMSAGITSKILRKGENNNQEYLSRGSGMAGGNTYAAGGGYAGAGSKGSSGTWTWGNSK